MQGRSNRVRIRSSQDSRRAPRETASYQPDRIFFLRYVIRGDFGPIRAQADKDASKPCGEASLRGDSLPGCKSVGIEECSHHDRSLRRFSMPRVQKLLRDEFEA